MGIWQKKKEEEEDLWRNEYENKTSKNESILAKETQYLLHNRNLIV